MSRPMTDSAITSKAQDLAEDKAASGADRFENANLRHLLQGQHVEENPDDGGADEVAEDAECHDGRLLAAETPSCC